MGTFKKTVSVLIVFAMLMACTVQVLADGELTVSCNVENDGYISVGSNIVLTFSQTVTEAQTSGISVTKVGGTENLIDSAAVNGSEVTLSFGDKLDYSASYKLTVPASAGLASDFVSYFSTYSKYFKGIDKMIISENFSNMDSVYKSFSGTIANEISGFRSSKLTGEPNTENIKIETVKNSYGIDGKSLYVASTGTNQYIVLESYNNRIKKPDNLRLAVSFKFKSVSGKISSMALKVNDSNTLTTITTSKITANGTAYTLGSDFDIGSWHEYTIEFDTSDSSAMKCVYAAIDGTPITVNAAMSPSVAVSEIGRLTLQIAGSAAAETNLYLDDFKVYVPSAPAASGAAVEVKNITSDSAAAEVSFTNPVDEATLSGISVKDSGGNAVIPESVKLSRDLKKVTLSLAGLLGNTKYTVSVPNTVKDIFANDVLAATGEFTTRTAEAPVLKIARPVISVDGNTASASAELVKNTTVSKDVTIIIALYDGIKLVDMKSVSKTFANDGRGDSISAQLTIPSGEHGNRELRAFVWDSADGMNNMVSASSKTERSARYKLQ